MPSDTRNSIFVVVVSMFSPSVVLEHQGLVFFSSYPIRKHALTACIDCTVLSAVVPHDVQFKYILLTLKYILQSAEKRVAA